MSGSRGGGLDYLSAIPLIGRPSPETKRRAKKTCPLCGWRVPAVEYSKEQLDCKWHFHARYHARHQHARPTDILGDDNPHGCSDCTGTFSSVTEWEQHTLTARNSAGDH